jgi:hypothetical protein
VPSRAPCTIIRPPETGQEDAVSVLPQDRLRLLVAPIRESCKIQLAVDGEIEVVVGV